LDVNYVLNNPMTYYNCLEIGRDLARAEAIVKTANALHMSGELLRESDVLDRFGKTFAERGADTNALLKNYLMVKDHGASFDLVVADIARISKTDQAQKAAGLPVKLTVPFLFSAKSGFY